MKDNPSISKENVYDDNSVEKFDASAVNSKEKQSLYAAREKIHPKRASGDFRKFKWWIMIVSLGIYYLTPWIRWDRGIGAPDQAVLLDMVNFRFYFFFIEIWPHEFYYVAGMLVMAGIGLFLVTSVFGRAWCGYTCPQTVWVDLFLVVERFIEGDRNARIKLDKKPLSISKAIKKIIKHTIWLVIGIATGGAWIFYFADAPTLLNSFIHGNAPMVAYFTVGILTATTYIFGGLMREQVCIYMCPWPRIQAAMLDEHSLTVTYNAWRGEQRSRNSKKQRQVNIPVGDCVDCNACVAVCPMGIDIRDGQQMECITCALCIDACDEVMDKVGLEKGLISYSTLNDYTQNMQLSGATGSVTEITGNKIYDTIVPAKIHTGKGLVSGIKLTSWKNLLTPRNYVYLAFYSAIGLAILSVLAMRETLDVNILHDRNPVFVKLRDGSIRNGFEIKILNMRGQIRQFWIQTEGLNGALMKPAGSQNLPTKSLLVEVPADKLRALKVFVTLPKNEITSVRTHFKFKVTSLLGAETTSTDANFESPKGYGK
ncbi:MAG: cytochrome c oxidase accessory protein CcoG [Hyphomicrobiales bacterium]|nr:cytochrome c oxidase accessory protein CcoG [Hyphomicrobiales bacterium]PCH49938.1 MAG: cytochrome c oxidase accessory protein CcoG [Hyphomicrobiales bacterium]